MDNVVKENVSGMFSGFDKCALKLLCIIFTIAPIVAGLDKFFNKLTDWQMYIAPFLFKVLPGNTAAIIRTVGVIEIIAGILVALKPRIGAFIVSAWLFLIVINLLLMQGYLDIALRDLGLAVCAFSLGLLSINHTCKCSEK